jgi:ABC-2 type transport system ATP-binding protein
LPGRGTWDPPPEDGPAVSVNGICKTYGRIEALDHVDLKVERGEMFGLIGPNGAGKSTLMKSLIGTVKPDCGEVKVLGLNPGIEGMRIKSFTGYVPESETPPSFLKLDEFLDFIMDTRGRKPDNEGKRRWVDFFDLESHRHTIAKDMSKGTRQKLMLSSAFIHKPPLLLLDEPFINLDPIYQRKVKDYLIEYVEGGGSVLLSTHILSLAEELCGRVSIINKGKVFLTDSTKDIVEDHGSLEKAFLYGVGYYSM